MFLLLSEAQGIPDAVKYYTNILYHEFIFYPKEGIIYKNDSDNYYIIVKGGDNKLSFFNELLMEVIIYENNHDASYYKFDVSGWDENNRKFDRIFIKINMKSDEIPRLREDISHELHHAYEDYKRIANKKEGFLDLRNNITSTDTIEMRAIYNEFKDDDILLKLSNYIYYLLGVEKRANVSAMYQELIKFKLTKQDINDGAYKKMRFYEKYLTIINLTPKMVDSLNSEQLELFGRYVRASSINKIYSPNSSVFKKNLINYFKTESEEMLIKSRKMLMEYLTDYHLLEKTNIDRPKSRNQIMDEIISSVTNLDSTKKIIK